MQLGGESNEFENPTRRDVLRRAGMGLAVIAGLDAFAGFGASASEAALSGRSGAIVRGGTLRVGLTGLSPSADQLNPLMTPVSFFDEARFKNVFSRMYAPLGDGTFVPDLAESAEPNKRVDVWTMKLKRGVTWHDGSPFSADDVVYTFGQILNTKNAQYKTPRGNLPMLKRVEKINAHTVRFILNQPWSAFPSQLGHITMAVMKVGTTKFALDTPGTGPFKLSSWSPGTNYVLTAFPDYFEHGKPYVKSVVVTGVADATARLNGLQAGQFDAIGGIDPTQTKVIEANSQLKLLVGPPGSWTPIVMNTKSSTFRDVRVRQAMKMLIDRHQTVHVGLQGYGAVGNDLFSIGDPLYASNIKQREYDPEHAKSLLKAAGAEGLTATLYATDLQPSMLSSALLFAQTAKAGGVTVKVIKSPAATYFTDVWGHQPFEQTYWSYRPFLGQWVAALTSGGYNSLETNWSNPQATKDINRVAASVDLAKNKEYAHKAQQLQWEQGGYINWGFQKLIDGLHKNVHGIEPSRVLPLGYFAFKDAWLT